MSGAEIITVQQDAIHGVECYEAWRREDDCTHEQRSTEEVE